MFAHMHYTKLSHVCTKMAELKYDFTRLSVCLSTILEFHNKWLLFLDHHCISFLNISSKFCKTLQLLRSSGNRHTRTQTDYYNPPPVLRLIIMYTMYTYQCIDISTSFNIPLSDTMVITS